MAQRCVKEGSLAGAREVGRRWDRERRPKLPGFVGTYLFQLGSDPGELVLVAVFTSKDAYVANVQDPDQDRWYRQLRERLDAAPLWHDRQVIAAY